MLTVAGPAHDGLLPFWQTARFVWRLLFGRRPRGSGWAPSAVVVASGRWVAGAVVVVVGGKDHGASVAIALPFTHCRQSLSRSR